MLYTDEDIIKVVKPYLFDLYNTKTLENIKNTVIDLIGPGNNVNVVYNYNTNSLDIVFNEINGDKRVITIKDKFIK
jgi:hypothetical protein